MDFDGLYYCVGGRAGVAIGAADQAHQASRSGSCLAGDPRYPRAVTRAAVGTVITLGLGVSLALGLVAELRHVRRAPSADALPPASSVPSAIASPPDTASPATDVVWHFDDAISVADRALLSEAAAADVAHVQSAFGRPFAAPVHVYVSATPEQFAVRLAEVFDLPSDRARTLAASYSGFTGVHERGGPERTALDWSRMSSERPQFRLRHELAHIAIHQLTGGSERIPSWLDEGLAEVASQTVPGLAWSALQSRFITASAAATASLVPLARLAHADQRLAVLAEQIESSTESARLLEQDFGHARVITLLERLAREDRFDVAFADVMGQRFAAFDASRAARFRALAPTTPGIATTPSAPDGPGLTYVVYGLAPHAPVTLTCSSAKLTVTHVETTNGSGAYVGDLTDAWPPDLYEITARQGATSLAVRASKLAKR